MIKKNIFAHLFKFMFSKACEYGIRAAIFIAEQSLLNNKVSKVVIAKAIDSPVEFTAKTLQILTKAGIVNSDRGPHGGFYFNQNQLHSIFLSDIVSLIDGNGIYENCGLGLKECSEDQPCPVHSQFKAIRSNLKKMLEHSSLYDLAIGLKAKETFLKR